MIKKRMGAFDSQASMTAYTKWWIAHPWHVSGTPESGKVPPDCDCEYCIAKRLVVKLYRRKGHDSGGQARTG